MHIVLFNGLMLLGNKKCYYIFSYYIVICIQICIYLFLNPYLLDESFKNIKREREREKFNVDCKSSLKSISHASKLIFVKINNINFYPLSI